MYNCLMRINHQHYEGGCKQARSYQSWFLEQQDHDQPFIFYVNNLFLYSSFLWTWTGFFVLHLEGEEKQILSVMKPRPSNIRRSLTFSFSPSLSISSFSSSVKINYHVFSRFSFERKSLCGWFSTWHIKTGKTHTFPVFWIFCLLTGKLNLILGKTKIQDEKEERTGSLLKWVFHYGFSVFISNSLYIYLQVHNQMMMMIFCISIKLIIHMVHSQENPILQSLMNLSAPSAKSHPCLKGKEKISQQNQKLIRNCKLQWIKYIYWRRQQHFELCLLLHNSICLERKARARGARDSKGGWVFGLRLARRDQNQIRNIQTFA